MPISHDSSTGAISTSTTASTSHSLGYGSGSNRIVVAYGLAFARKQTDSVISSLTYNGVEGTYLGTVVSDPGANAPHVRVSAYYWLDSSLPSSSGSYTVSLTTVKATDCGFTVTSIIDAKQQAPDAANSSGSDVGGTNIFSTSLTPNSVNAYLIDGACVRTSGTATVDSGQTERYDANPGFNLCVCSTRPATTIISYTMGWTCDAENWQDYAQYVTSWAPLAEVNNPLFAFAGLT
jgi:hypothetical protein